MKNRTARAGSANHPFDVFESGFRWIEALIVALLAIIASCFAIQIWLADPVWGDVIRGFAPTTQIVTNPDMLYLATDVGVYYTRNSGNTWLPIADGMPVVVCSDLKLHQPTRTLLVGTYGRSAYKLDLNLFLGMEQKNNLSFDISIFPNPVNAEIASLSYSLLYPSEIIVSIFDITGKLILSQKNNGHVGKNIFPVSFNNTPQGIYLVNIKDGIESVSLKVLVN